eukprot:1186032-Prorocentrum_minimum.AAC.2
MFDNFYIRSLLGERVFSLPPGGITIIHEERARHVLERFALVLPSVELREPLWVVLEAVLGWKLSEDARRVYNEPTTLPPHPPNIII